MSDTLVPDASADQRRLDALLGHGEPDSPVESDLDDILRLTTHLCGVPAAAVCLLDGDRHWVRAQRGTDILDLTPEHVLGGPDRLGDEIVQVRDARRDPHRRTSNIVFYAAAPLVTAGGRRLGALCVADRMPRELTDGECHGLRTLARHALTNLELSQYTRGLDTVNERLRAADRLRDEFLARVTHELRTPLTSINGYLEMLDDPDVRSGAGTIDFLHRIRRNSDRLMALVDDMLLAAQSALTLQRRVVDLADLARTAVERDGPLAHGRGLAVVADVAGPVLVEGDERRLGQALERLLLNAVKFTPRGGIVVRAARTGPTAVLEVRDTGVGMSAEEQARVFEPFARAASAERAEVQGAGLGLGIVKAIVDSHGGTLGVASTPGLGATVSIELPGYGG